MRLSLDDHPGRCLPRLQGRPIDRATLLHLGTCTAGGLPLQFPDDVGNDDDAAISYLHAWKADASPGTVREHSNPSLGLLGAVTAADMIRFVPAKRIGLLMLANRNFPIPARVEAAYAILDQLAPKPR